MQWKTLFSRKNSIFFLVALIFICLQLFQNAAEDSSGLLPPSVEKHIIYGNSTGGGHLYGVGRPCKSEFPKDWTVEKIIQTVKSQAVNDNLSWRQEDNGYQVSEKQHGKVRVRVVLNENKSRIITAYPTNRGRNPCERE